MHTFLVQAGVDTFLVQASLHHLSKNTMILQS